MNQGMFLVAMFLVLTLAVVGLWLMIPFSVQVAYRSIAMGYTERALFRCTYGFNVLYVVVSNPGFEQGGSASYWNFF
jgi:hypothetical protein